MSRGIQTLERELADLGYLTERPIPTMVAFHFEVPHGRFKGKQIEIALQALNFPHHPPTGLYIKPLLLPAQSGGVHPLGGIHNRNTPGPDWQYWSRPIQDWSNTDKTVKTYLAFIRTIFDFEI